MVKEAMAHLLLLRFAVLLVTLSCVQCQLFYHSPIRPVFIVQRPTTRNGQESPERAAAVPQRDQFNPNARSDLTSSEEEQNDGDAGSAEASFERRNETKLPEDFEKNVRANRPPLEPRPSAPMYGDPAIMEDEDEEQDRSRFLWPFSTSVTVTKSKGHPHHRHHGHGGHGPSFPPGFPKPPLLPPHLQHQHHHDHHGDLEYEKTRLKYEIYKLKAKKTIAILQNKVELKKILSLLLQQKIKALEWITWYHDYVEQMYNQANGWDAGDGDGWDSGVPPLTDEEILHSKGTSKSKSSKWSSYLGRGILSRLRTSLTSNIKDTDRQEASSAPIRQQYRPQQQQAEQQQKLQAQQQHYQQLQAQRQHYQQLHAQQQQLLQPPEKKKPFLQKLLTPTSTLLKYIGIGKQQKPQATHEMLNRPQFVGQQQFLRNDNPQSQEQSEEQADDQEDKQSNEDHEDNKDEEETRGDDPEDTTQNKSEENADNGKDESLAHDNNQEQEPGESNNQENEMNTEREKSTETTDKSEEEEAAEDKSTEDEKSEEEQEEDKNDSSSVDNLKIDIDEELSSIELPNRGNRLRSGNQNQQPAASGPNFPTKKEKKKKKFQDKVYNFLFKTMDVLDKHFMSDDDEEVLDVVKTKPKNKNN